MEHQENLEAYEQPAVVFESDLEVRAGSPISIPNPLDLFGTGE